MEAITPRSGAAANQLSGASRLLHPFASVSQPDDKFGRARHSVRTGAKENLLQKAAKETKILLFES